MKGKGLRGFTLIELLVTLSILAVTLGVVGASLAAGLRAWEQARAYGAMGGDAAIGLSVIRRDLMNAHVFHAVPFDGEADRVSFAGMKFVDDGAGGGSREPGRVEYAFDRRRGAVVRTWTAVRLRPEEGGLTSESLVLKVEDLAFRYADEADGGGKWNSVWQSDSNLPVAVEIELRVGPGVGAGVVRETVVPVVAADR